MSPRAQCVSRMQWEAGRQADGWMKGARGTGFGTPTAPCHGDTVTSEYRPAKRVPTDNSPQTDVLRGGDSTAAVSTKTSSISVLRVPPTLSVTQFQGTARSDVSDFVGSNGCVRNCSGFGDCQKGLAPGRDQTQQVMG